MLRRSEHLTTSCCLQPAGTRPPWAYDCAKGCTDVSPGGDFTCAQQASGPPTAAAVTHHGDLAMPQRATSCWTGSQPQLPNVTDRGRRNSAIESTEVVPLVCSCLLQKGFGKCCESWMKAGNSATPRGYCTFTCDCGCCSKAAFTQLHMQLHQPLVMHESGD